MPIIHVKLGSRSYDIQLHDHAFMQFAPWLASLGAGRLACLIYDEHVAEHAFHLKSAVQRAGFQIHTVQLPAGEEQKCLATLGTLYDALAEMKADRQTFVIALGGGVMGDLAGFAAASFNRGLPLVMVPTTLLAMVDSSVGGKVGINHAAGKNLIGAFHQPRGVWIDPHYLSTLPGREYRSGLAEVVKYGMILDAEFFTWLETYAAAILQQKIEPIKHLVLRSCQLKAQVVEQDEYETQGLRAMLNFGHTFAHAFEKVAGYGKLLHGEAVSIGMVCACRLAHQLGMIGNDITVRLQQLLERFQLPVAVAPVWNQQHLLDAMRHDKKNVAGELRFVLPTRLGEVKAGVKVDEAAVRQILAQRG